MNKKVVIIGASGHGKVIADIVIQSGDQVVGFLDDADSFCEGDSFIGYPYVGKVSDYDRFLDNEFVIAIGDADIRKRISEKLSEVAWYTAIHPAATIASIDVSIEKGTVIMAGAIINPGTHIGCHCIINTGAIVDHDNRIGDYVHVSVGAKLAGTVSIGNGTWIGTGATVRNNISICEDCMIGAGAVVVKDITVPGQYVGVPAKHR